MKILKLLNKLIISLFVFFLIYLTNVFANEPADIWELKNIEEDQIKIDTGKIKSEINKKDTINLDKEINSSFLDQEKLNLPTVNLIGLYDPEENNLAIDMWLNSDGDQIKTLMKNINSISLSKDASEILKIALLTNSYIPQNQINSDTFINYKTNFLRKNEDLNLIKDFLLKNSDLTFNDELIKYYIDEYLLDNNIEKSCSLFDEITFKSNNNYLDKFKIYCLIDQKKLEEAQLNYDLKKETGFRDIFFEENFKLMMGYTDEIKNKISETSVLNFHLSHVNNFDFSYKPNEKTPKFIWRYLSNYNLLEQISEIDLEDEKNIMTIEKATHEQNYKEKELLNLYKRFQFTLDDFLNVKNKYSDLPNYKSRALLYQRFLLTYDISEKLFLLEKLKKSTIKDSIGNAFNVELSNILKQIDEKQIPAEYSTFYKKNIIPSGSLSKKIKFNNKILHQSKLLNYFSKNYSIERLSKDTNDLLKKVKANKKYVFSSKDKMLLDSIIFDGAKIQKKFDNLYDRDPNVPTDLQVLINNDDVGMILLRLVEIIGEDNIEDLGTETQYFIITVLNQINLDKIRNSILLEILPLRV